MGLEEFPSLLGLFCCFAHARACAYNKQRQMIAPAIFGIQNVVAQAQTIRLWLAPKPEYVQRPFRPGSEQLNGVAIAFRLEKLPERLHSHELCRFCLHGLDIMKQLERLCVALSQQLFEIALEAEVPPVQHVRIDIAPDLG